MTADLIPKRVSQRILAKGSELRSQAVAQGSPVAFWPIDASQIAASQPAAANGEYAEVQQARCCTSCTQGRAYLKYNVE